MCTTESAIRERSAEDGSSTDSRRMRLAALHAVSAALATSSARHDLVLHVLGAVDGRLVVLQIVGELEQELGGRATESCRGCAAPCR